MDEILNLIESVSEGFPSYFFNLSSYISCLTIPNILTFPLFFPLISARERTHLPRGRKEVLGKEERKKDYPATLHGRWGTTDDFTTTVPPKKVKVSHSLIAVCVRVPLYLGHN